jgi:CsoR family transcriptional regulator, copper-sensing transcriptional repressor
MDSKTRDQVIRRLRSIQGHVKGIEKMVEEDQYCIDVMRQVIATQAAMAKVNEMILENHLNTCVIEAVRGDAPQARERVLEEIGDMFEMSRKV